MLARIGQGYLGLLIGHVPVFNNYLELVNLDIASFIIISDLDFHVLGKAPQNGCAHSFLKRVDQHVAVNALVLAYLVNGLFEFKIHIVSMQCQAKGKKPGFLPSSRFFPGRNILFAARLLRLFENMDAAYAPGRFERK